MQKKIFIKTAAAILSAACPVMPLAADEPVAPSVDAVSPWYAGGTPVIILAAAVCLLAAAVIWLLYRLRTLTPKTPDQLQVELERLKKTSENWKRALDQLSRMAHFVCFESRNRGREIINLTPELTEAIYGREKIVSPEELIVPEDLPEYILKRDMLFSGELKELTHVFRSVLTGEERYLQIIARLKTPSRGSKSPLMVFLRDVTDSWRQDEALRSSANIWREASRGFPLFLYIKDPAAGFKYIAVNDNMAEFFGKPVDSFAGLTDRDIFAGETDEYLKTLSAEDTGVVAANVPCEFKNKFTVNGVEHTYRTIKRVCAMGCRNVLLGCSMDITDIEKMRVETESANQFFSFLIENMPFAILLKDKDGMFRFCSERYCAMMHISRDDAKKGMRGLAVPQEKMNRIVEEDKKIMAEGGTLRTREEENIGGRTHIFEKTKFRLKYSDGQHYVAVVFQDITTHTELLKHDETVCRVISRIAVESDLMKNLVAISEMIKKSLSTDGVAFFGIGKKGDAEMVFRDGADKIDDAKLRNIAELSVADLRENKTVTRSASGKDPWLYAADGIGAIMVTPVNKSGVLAGAVVMLYSKEREFSEMDIRAAQSAGGLAAVVRDKMIVAKQTRKAEYERRKILDNISAPVVLYDSDRRIVHANEVLCRLTGMQLDELKNRGICRYMCRDKGESACPVKQSLETKRSVVSERVAADGRHYILTTRPELDENGHVEYVFTAASDVTDIERERERASAAGSLLESVAGSLSCGVAIKDAADSFRVIYCNDAYASLAGVKAGDIRGKTDADAVLFASAKTNDKSVMESGRVSVEKLTLGNMPDGKKHIVNARRLPLESKSGKFLVCTVEDVTESIELSERQSELIENLRTSLESYDVINKCLRRLAVYEDYDQAVNMILKLIGESIGSDRTYFYECGDDGVFRSKYEWCRESSYSMKTGGDSIESKGLPESFIRMLNDRRDVVIDDVFNPPEECGDVDFLRKSGVRSIIMTGVWRDGKLIGAGGSTFMESSRSFSNNEISMAHNIVIIINMLEERKRVHEKIDDAVHSREQILENISIPVGLFKPDGRIMLVSRSARGRFVPASAALTKESRCMEFCGVAKNLCNGETCALKSVMEHKKTVTKITSKYGGVLRVVAQPVNDLDGEMKYILVTGYDISDIVSAGRQLEDSMLKASDDNRRRSAFFGTLGHDFRTPLNSLIGFSELLRDVNLAAAQRLEYVENICDSGKKLLDLVNNVIEFLRLDSGSVTLMPEPSDVGSTLGDIIKIYAHRASEKHIRLTADTGGLPYIRVDRLRIIKIFSALIDNAILNSPENGTASVACSFTTNGGADDNGKGTLVFSVCDSGSPVDPRSMDGLFLPPIKSRYENRISFGFGLPIAGKLASLMGGTITMSAGPDGKGAKFTFELKDVEYGSESEVAETTSKDIERSICLEGKTVLAVDDMPSSLKLISALIGRMGGQVLTASTAADAMKILETNAVDIVFTDLWMPGATGWEFMSGIKKIFAEKKRIPPPVFVTTADISCVEEYPTSEFAGVVFKPLSRGGIYSVLKRSGVLER